MDEAKEVCKLLENSIFEVKSVKCVAFDVLILANEKPEVTETFLQANQKGKTLDSDLQAIIQVPFLS